MEFLLETWRDVPSVPGYQASSEGRIRSKARVVAYRDGRSRAYPGVVLQPGKSREYLIVGVGKRRMRPVHLLVAEAFLGPRPEGLQACHNDGDASNNRPSNLRWDTPSENSLDRQRHGTDHKRNTASCPLGHTLSGHNLRAAPLKFGRRECRSCASARSYLDRHPGASMQHEADRYYATYVKKESA